MATADMTDKIKMSQNVFHLLGIKHSHLPIPLKTYRYPYSVFILRLDLLYVQK